ncbi:hydroxyacid dehydrogenase [Termitidicoccus mucosus]|uniref:D-isomer specific 2-hydroxyacid dehydrogenase NAD-binding domain-containing protein n=1 Tax=Termitidicoccus mucosus TaxID=1184151 RepID=A0A178IKU9_9BACT|nr:hypothetical protein AW736_07655 [Opitutaceae bacterium TSB47]
MPVRPSHSNADASGGPSAPARETRTAPPAVLFALAPVDRRLFLDASLMPWDTFAGAAQWIDPTAQSPETWRETLRRIEPEVIVSGWETLPLPEQWIQDPGCRLRYVCHLAGSVRRLVPRAFLARGGLVSNWGGIAAASVAEHALLLILAALRDLGSWRDHIAALSAQGPQERLPTRPLRGRRIGLHGFGGIARALVALLRSFGVTIRAFSEGVPAGVFHEHGVERCDSLEALFGQSDVLVECEALTEKTRGSVTAALLRLLPDDAVFVNVGRGRVVAEDALAEAASSRRLRVAVDVVSNEPIQEDHPLLRAPGAIVSPHIGGPTREEYGLCGRRAWENLNRYLRGEPPEDDSLVSLELYDRST